MKLYKVWTEDDSHGSDCIEAKNFNHAEDIAFESITRLKTELGITKKLYVVVELLDCMGNERNPLYENHFIEFFV